MDEEKKHDETFCYLLVIIIGMIGCDMKPILFYAEEMALDVEIVGNIHENPEAVTELI